MALQHLIECVQGDFTLLEHILGKKGSVDVFPLVAELLGEVVIEASDALAVHLVQAKRGL